MDEQEVAKLLDYMFRLTMDISMKIRERKDEGLNRAILPLLEGQKFNYGGEHSGLWDCIDILRDEFPLEEDEEEDDESDEDESDESEDSEDAITA